jgi:hypothetical protein
VAKLVLISYPEIKEASRDCRENECTSKDIPGCPTEREEGNERSYHEEHKEGREKQCLRLVIGMIRHHDPRGLLYEAELFDAKLNFVINEWRITQKQQDAVQNEQHRGLNEQA